MLGLFQWPLHDLTLATLHPCTSLSDMIRACHSSAHTPSRASFFRVNPQPSCWSVGFSDASYWSPAHSSSHSTLTTLAPCLPPEYGKYAVAPRLCPPAPLAWNIPPLDKHIAYFLKVLFSWSLAEGPPLISSTVKLCPFTLLYSPSLSPQIAHCMDLFIVYSLKTNKATLSPSTRL